MRWSPAMRAMSATFSVASVCPPTTAAANTSRSDLPATPSSLAVAASMRVARSLSARTAGCISSSASFNAHQRRRSRGGEARCAPARRSIAKGDQRVLVAAGTFIGIATVPLCQAVVKAHRNVARHGCNVVAQRPRSRLIPGPRSAVANRPSASRRPTAVTPLGFEARRNGCVLIDQRVMVRRGIRASGR